MSPKKREPHENDDKAPEIPNGMPFSGPDSMPADAPRAEAKADGEAGPVEPPPEPQGPPAVVHPEPPNPPPAVNAVMTEEGRLYRLIQKKTRDGTNEIDKSIPSYDPMVQKLFEAPDGAILVGDITSDRIFYRKMNMWINPKRIRLTPEERAKRQLARERMEEKNSSGYSN